MDIGNARLSDASFLASLLGAYLTESFPGHSGTSAAVLERDVLGGGSILRVLLVERRGVPVGFAAWHRVYDLHWGKGGAEIDDLYLVPQYRGNGIALALVAAVCSAARQEGLVYLHGTSFDRESPVGRFYDRIAVVGDSAQCYCAGRAFLRLAELHGQSPHDIARSLPPKAWNYEP
jgi:GNAT superfamily N-acetyltransferase